MTFNLRHLIAALALHGLLLFLLVGGLQCSKKPVRPPVIQAVLVDPKQVPAQKRADEQKRLDEQKRAEQRRQAEAEKKRLAEEKKRLAEAEKKQQDEARRKIEQEQKKREADAEKKRLADEAQRKKAEDLKRQKELAEQKKAEEQARRQQEQEEQRERQEQAQRELQEKARMEEQLRREAIALEAEREAAARAASERDRKLAEWADVLSRHIQRSWIRPSAAPAQFQCTVQVKLLPDGTVTSARIDQTCGSSALDKSVEDAAYRSSPMPKPSDPSVFDRDLIIHFNP